MTIGPRRAGYGVWARVIAPACLAVVAAGCAPQQLIEVTNRTDERVHVEVQQAFVGYSLFQNPQRFRFVVEPGRVWSSDDATASDRVSFDDQRPRGVITVRVREEDVMAPWTEAGFEAVEELRVLVNRDADGRWRVVREVVEQAGEGP